MTVLEYLEVLSDAFYLWITPCVGRCIERVTMYSKDSLAAIADWSVVLFRFLSISDLYEPEDDGIKSRVCSCLSFSIYLSLPLHSSFLCAPRFTFIAHCLFRLYGPTRGEVNE